MTQTRRYKVAAALQESHLIQLAQAALLVARGTNTTSLRPIRSIERRYEGKFAASSL